MPRRPEDGGARAAEQGGVDGGREGRADQKSQAAKQPAGRRGDEDGDGTARGGLNSPASASPRRALARAALTSPTCGG